MQAIVRTREGDTFRAKDVFCASDSPTAILVGSIEIRRAGTFKSDPWTWEPYRLLGHDAARVEIPWSNIREVMAYE